jgi:MYXO-CTERM domain-containing protein
VKRELVLASEPIESGEEAHVRKPLLVVAVLAAAAAAAARRRQAQSDAAALWREATADASR